MKNKSVVQDWVTNNCSWKEQTVLFCAIRGPDAGGSPQLKSWTRFIRRNVLQNAAPNKTFMRQEMPEQILILAGNHPLIFDMLPVHYFGHLLHALQVIAYRCDDGHVSGFADIAYRQLCAYMHLNPETSEEMTERLKDEV